MDCLCRDIRNNKSSAYNMLRINFYYHKGNKDLGEDGFHTGAGTHRSRHYGSPTRESMYMDLPESMDLSQGGRLDADHAGWTVQPPSPRTWH